jgi:hypothetical protein
LRDYWRTAVANTQHRSTHVLMLETAMNVSRPNQFLAKHRDAFPTDASLRWYLFSRRKRLESAGAVFKVGRCLFIDEDKFFAVLRDKAAA